MKIKLFVLILLISIISCYHKSLERNIDSYKVDHLYIPLKGSILSCKTKPLVYIKQKDKWRLTNQELPYKGIYYLDDKFIGYGWCDTNACKKVDSILVNLLEYEKIGMRKAPLNSEVYKGSKVPVYRSKYLSGEIKIVIEYFSDSVCSKKEVVEKILNIQ
jgi:hypothetical protein